MSIAALAVAQALTAGRGAELSATFHEVLNGFGGALPSRALAVTGG